MTRPVNNAHSGWDDARIVVLEKLWREGISASQIGARLGVSRNAVIGKAHRLGLKDETGKRNSNQSAAGLKTSQLRRERTAAALAGMPAVARAEPSPPRKFTPNPIYKGDPTTSPMTKKLEAIEAQLVARGPAQPQSLKAGTIACADLEHHHCRWPIGDPQSGPFGFCGRQRGDAIYCPPHAAAAKGYTPTRRDDVSRLARLAR